MYAPIVKQNSRTSEKAIETCLKDQFYINQLLFTINNLGCSNVYVNLVTNEMLKNSRNQ